MTETSNSPKEEPRIKQLLERNLYGIPFNDCVVEQGDFYCGEFHHDMITKGSYPNGNGITASPSLSPIDYERIEDAVEVITPKFRAGFANALQMWEENLEFTYVEGVGVLENVATLYPHAWNLVDGELVDVTPAECPFDEYFGIVFDDADLLSRYVELGHETDAWGILSNQETDNQYLRYHGFL